MFSHSSNEFGWGAVEWTGGGWEDERGRDHVEGWVPKIAKTGRKRNKLMISMGC